MIGWCAWDTALDVEACGGLDAGVPCAICPGRVGCKDHRYVYVRGDCRHECETCGQPPPDDFYDLDPLEG